MSGITDRDIISLGKSPSQIQLQNLAISDFDQALRISDQIQGELKEYITEVVLDNVHCSSKNATKVLLHAICECSSVTSFRWSNSPNLHEDLDQLDVLLCDTKSIRSLDLSGNNLASAAVQTLMRPYTFSPTELASTASLFSLTSLNLSRNNIGDAGVLVICRSLLQFSRRASSQKIPFHLEELHIDDCGLSDKSAYCLAQLLNAKSTPTPKPVVSSLKTIPASFPLGLRVLNISNNPNITCDGITALLGDFKIGSISPLVKLFASRCHPGISIFYELAMRLSNGLCPKLEVLDLSFSDSGADAVIKQSAANYNKIFSAPICESLGRSLKVLSDTLVLTTHPGPSKTGPKYGSPSKGNRSNVSIKHIFLGQLPEAMFNACVSRLNFSDSNNFSERNKLSPSGQRRHHLYEDCLMGLESINPAAKFFDIDYVTNIAAWVEEGHYDNSRFIHKPPSVGNRFATVRSVDAEIQHVQRIRDSSPNSLRAITNISQSERANSKDEQTRANIQLATSSISSPQIKQMDEKQFTTPVKKQSSPIPTKNNSSTLIITNEESTVLPQSPSSPSSPSFKRALSMSETLKSAIKDLTERVKASQISLEHSIKAKSGVSILDDITVPVPPNNNANNINIQVNKEEYKDPVSSRKEIASSITVAETEQADVTADSIKAIVEETINNFLSSSNNKQLFQQVPQDHRPISITKQTTVLSNTSSIPEASPANGGEYYSSSAYGDMNNDRPHNEKFSQSISTTKSNKEQLLSERNQLLEYLQRSKEDVHDMRATSSSYHRGSQDKHLENYDALMILTLEERLKSVEQLLYYQYLDDRNRKNQSSSSPERSLNKRNISEEKNMESNPLARRLISSLVNQPIDTVLADKSISSIVENQRQNEKRLVYVDDVEQRLELIEHLLEFDQELQREQDTLASRVAQSSFPSDTSSLQTTNAVKIDKRLQRKDWIDQIHKNKSFISTHAYAPIYLNQSDVGNQSFLQQPFITNYDLNGTFSAENKIYDDFGYIFGGNNQLAPKQIMNTSYMLPLPRTPVHVESTPRRSSTLSFASRQSIVGRHNAGGHLAGTRRSDEEEVESVHSLPRHRRLHNASQSQHTPFHNSSTPPLPNVNNYHHYPKGHSALPLPPLPFTTPGFLYSQQAVPYTSETTPLSMQDQWHQITPTIRCINPGSLSESYEVSRSNNGVSTHHYMQSTTSSAMKSNLHNFHPSDSIHYRWTPSGIASNNHFDNPSPPIIVQHKKRR